MGQYVDVGEEVTALAIKASNENREEFSKELKNRYLSTFKQLRSNLENSYKYQSYTLDIQDRQSIAEKQRNNIIKAYASSRGKADIVLQKDITEYIKKEKELQDKLKDIRNQMYEVEDNLLYKKFATQMMALTYALKRDLNQGKEEHFAFIYKGDSSAAVAFDVPVTQFLLNEQFLDSIDLTYGAISSWTGGIDQSLRFNNSIGAQLEKMAQQSKNGITKTTLNEDFMNQRKRFIKTKRTYKSEVWANKRIEDLQSLNAIDIKIYRTDENYIVVESGAFQGGFVDQGLYGYYQGDENATFANDQRDWHKGADTVVGNMEYSVKSLLGGNPSLVSFNSLYNVSNQIITLLEVNNDPNEAAEQIKSYVFEIDKAVNTDVGKVVNFLG